MFEQIVSLLNRIVWSPALVILLVGAGLYFTLRTRFVQVRRFGRIRRNKRQIARLISRLGMRVKTMS